MSFTGYLTLTEINHTYGTVVLTQKAHCEYYLIYNVPINIHYDKAE